jgi:hypothetical protein
VLRSLGSEEIDKDLRHFQAYHRAVVSYRQQYYLAVNPNLVLPSSAGCGGSGGSGSGPQSSSALQGGGGMGVPSSAASPYLLHHPHSGGIGAAALPVRIDPEEEKRLALLRRKIARAEYMREDLEQQYVSLRAHYVQRSKEIRQLREHVLARQDFLRTCVRERAAMLGLMRSRLQITRDVLAALQRRGHVLEHQQQQQVHASTAVEDVSMDDPTTSAKPGSVMPAANVATSATTVTATASNPLALEDIWNLVDEEFKKQQRKLVVGGSGSANPKGTGKAIVWPCTKMPPTPHGVPLLLSNVSNAPEKSVAFYANGIFGSDKAGSLAWILPETVPASEDNHDGDVRGDDDRAGSSPAPGAASASRRQRELEGLREEVAFLQNELAKERRQSQQISETVARARSKNDEWVAMICLVRQETEAVLHRHNIVLESDVARMAAERLYEQELDAKNQRKLQDEADAAAAVAAASKVAEAGATAPSVSGGEGPGVDVLEVDMPVAAPAGGEEGDDGATDEDNDGDDEGSEDEDQPDGEERAVEEEQEEEREEDGEAGNEDEPSSNPRGNHNKRSAQVDAAADVEDTRKKRRKV